jgi:glycosyltransferase involved in cell wall biosynthesis
VRGLVRALKELGHEVLVITPHGEGDERIGVPVVPVPVPEIVDAISSAKSPPSNRRLARALGHLWNNVAVERVLRDVLSTYGADFLYERYSPFGVAGALIGNRMGVRHVLEVNAPLAWEGREYRHQALQEAAETLEQAAFSAASLIVAVSSELRDALIEAGVPASKIAVVPNGVDADLFTPAGEAYRNGFEGKCVVGFVGSLKAWHGLDLLAEAFRRLASDPRYHLLIVGQGPQAKLIESLLEELPGRVTQVGAVPHAEVPKYLRAMDIAVAPYPPLERFYFSPLKVLEYMAAARAVVATRIGQLKELVRSGETGILVEPGDPEALANAIRALAMDESLRHDLGDKAAKVAQREHRWTARAASIVDRVKELA